MRRTLPAFLRRSHLLQCASAPSPEEEYRVPQDRQALLRMLPLPKYFIGGSSKNQRAHAARRMLKRQLSAPKPQWFDGLTQAQLYDSCLKYVTDQLTDMRLYKEEKYLPHPADKGGRALEKHLAERVVQPRFSDLRPDHQRERETLSCLPPSMSHLAEELQNAKPSLLPHPALSAYGQTLVQGWIVRHLVDMFPRIHSSHLRNLVNVKTCLPTLVEVGVRTGLARGMGLQRECKLYKRVTAANNAMITSRSEMQQLEKEIVAGRYTANLRGTTIKYKKACRLMRQVGMRDEHLALLEERMKLLARHVEAFIAFSVLAKGQSLGRSILLRYLMPDIATQYFSRDPEMRAWLEVNHRWKFTPWQQAKPGLLPSSSSTTDTVPMVINGVETHTGVVSPSVARMLKSPNPMKELQLITEHDITARAMLKGNPLSYKLLFQGHRGEVGEKFYRVGVYSGETLLGEGDGYSYEDAAAEAAQNTLYSYFMNPKANFAPPPEPNAPDTAKPTKKKKKRKQP